MTISVIDALKSIQIQEQNKQILFPVDSLMNQVWCELEKSCSVKYFCQGILDPHPVQSVHHGIQH